MPNDTSFLGKGFRFPFRFSRVGGLKALSGVAQVHEISKINSSMRYILSTGSGERVMRRSFGSDLRQLLFEPNDPSLDVRINYIIQNSIGRWEPRVILNQIDISRRFYKEGLLEISIVYTIIRSNIAGNLVYPFYLGRNSQATDNTRFSITTS